MTLVCRLLSMQQTVGVVLCQRHRRFVGIEPAMGYEVGLHLEARGSMIHWQVWNGCWSAPAI